MSLRTILLPALLLVTIGGLASASAQSISSERSADALIVGQVIDSSTGNALSGALVTLSRINEAVALDSSSLRPRTVVSTADGRYVFRSLSAGRYTIGASKPGYVAGGFGSRRPGGRPQLLVLADHQKLNASPITLWKLAALSGRVVDDGGEPVVAARVRALRAGAAARPRVRVRSIRLPPRTTGASIASLGSRQGIISFLSAPSLMGIHFSTRQRSMVPRGHPNRPRSSRWRRATIAPALTSCCQPRPAFASAEQSRIQADRRRESQSSCAGRIPKGSRSIWRSQQR